jgi:hypothetical protein
MTYSLMHWRKQMTDDLVKRLEDYEGSYAKADGDSSITLEAAARIERLEAALREVISVSDRKTDIYDRAKALLEKKDD